MHPHTKLVLVPTLGDGFGLHVRRTDEPERFVAGTLLLEIVRKKIDPLNFLVFFRGIAAFPIELVTTSNPGLTGRHRPKFQNGLKIPDVGILVDLPSRLQGATHRPDHKPRNRSFPVHLAYRRLRDDTRDLWPENFLHEGSASAESYEFFCRFVLDRTRKRRIPCE